MTVNGGIRASRAHVEDVLAEHGETLERSFYLGMDSTEADRLRESEAAVAEARAKVRRLAEALEEAHDALDTLAGAAGESETAAELFGGFFDDAPEGAGYHALRAIERAAGAEDGEREVL